MMQSKHIVRLLASSLATAITILAFTLGLSSASATPRVAPPVQSPQRATESVPRIENAECLSFEFLASDSNVQCGYLVVLENRQDPSSRTIKVAYAVIKAQSANRQADPLVYLPGGPGDTAINRSWLDWVNGSLAARDLIIVDPRGVGYSQPQMKCSTKTPSATSIQSHPPSAAETRAFALQWAQTCHDLLLSQGFDLTQYNSAANLKDLEDLRRALGYSQWNLYGISYGTRTALLMMRASPQAIRSVVLDSVLPPQIDRIKTYLTTGASALAALFTDCRADQACDRDYPNLEMMFAEILQRAEQNPIEAAIPDPTSGQTQRVWLTGGTLFSGVSQMPMSPWLTQITPIAIQQVHAGNTSIIERLAGSLIVEENQAFYYSVLCHDGGSVFYPDEWQAALEKYPSLKAYYGETEDQAICKMWGVGQASPQDQQPVSSDIPTLIMTGAHYDSSTPPRFAKLAASTLSHNFLYEFPTLSHAASSDDCPKAMLAAFLDNPTTAPDSSCMAQIKGLPFVSDVYVNPGIFNAVNDLRFASNPWTQAAFALSILLLASTLIVLPISYVRSRQRSVQNNPMSNRARLLLLMIALLNLGFALGVWLLLNKAMEETYGWVTLFGFSPRASQYLFLVPWLSASLTVALLAFAVLAWKNGWWGRFERIYYTLATVGAVGFIVLLLNWHVLAV